MKQAVLLINFKDDVKLRTIKTILLTQKISIKTVNKSEYLQSIGYLAGDKSLNANEDIYEGEDLSKEVMVFVGLSGIQLDRILSMMRKKSVRKVDYKAVLTDTNKNWTVIKLYNELEKEHLTMQEMKNQM